MQQHSIILAPNYLVSIQAGEDNHFSVWLRRIPPLVFWHCTAPRCGISKFISFTTEPNEGSWWCKHRRGAAKTDMEPTSITTERDGEPRKRFLILNSLYSSTTAKKKKNTHVFNLFQPRKKWEKHSLLISRHSQQQHAHLPHHRREDSWRANRNLRKLSLVCICSCPTERKLKKKF